MLDEALERLVRRATEADGGVDLGRAREVFHARTGPFAPGDAWYEPRIRFFLDWYLFGWVSADGTRPAERAAVTDAERALAGACVRAARSLYQVLDEETPLRLADTLGGGRFRLAEAPSLGPDRLRTGDIFDGHLVVVDERIGLAPGRIFHPAETHGPIDEILRRAHAAGLERPAVLDGLLRMRMRLDRFTNIRARHIYRFEALGDTDILSAAWARREPARDGD